VQLSQCGALAGSLMLISVGRVTTVTGSVKLPENIWQIFCGTVPHVVVVNIIHITTVV